MGKSSPKSNYTHHYRTFALFIQISTLKINIAYLLSTDVDVENFKIIELIDTIEEARNSCVNFNHALRDLNVEMQKYLFNRIIEQEKVDIKSINNKSILNLIDKHKVDVSN
jgi:hypothetical protein